MIINYTDSNVRIDFEWEEIDMLLYNLSDYKALRDNIDSKLGVATRESYERILVLRGIRFALEKISEKKIMEV